MSDLKEIISFSIDLSKVDKARIRPFTRKDGTVGKALDLSMFINNEPDQYNNISGIALSQTKEERDGKVKKVYIGNGKRTWAASGATATAPASNNSASDDLPF